MPETTVPPEVPLPGATKRHPVYVWLEDHGASLGRHDHRLDRLELVIVVLLGSVVGGYSAAMVGGAILAWTWLRVAW